MSKEDTDIFKVFKREIKRVEKSLEQVDIFYRSQMRWFDRAAKNMGEILGSWQFVWVFILVVIAWVTVNVTQMIAQPFDPMPFSLFNTIMSIIAVIQASIFLMAQNAVSKRDQARLELDLEKDLRDLSIDQKTYELLVEIQKDIKSLKSKK